MLNTHCGWLFSCLVITILQQKTHATMSTSSTTTETSSMTPTHRQTHHQKQQQSMNNNQTKESDTDTEPGVTCYTCVNVSDNLVCNRFAIDRPCPQGENFCHTLHIMDSRGESVVVNKKCADRSECSPRRVGCLSIDTQTVCVSCCDEMYCNISVPSNQSTAVFSDTRAKARQQSQHQNERNSTNNSSCRLPQSPIHKSTQLLIVVLIMTTTFVEL